MFLSLNALHITGKEYVECLKGYVEGLHEYVEYYQKLSTFPFFLDVILP